MNKKRILIIEDQNQLSGLSPASDCQLFVTYDPQQALSLLMGCGTLIRSRFSEEKVRPDLLLMHASFFHQESGIEFLELIKKYYSLKNIRVFLFGEAAVKPDSANLTRYNIVQFLELPLQLDSLITYIDDSVDGEYAYSKKFWSFPALLVEDHLKPFFHNLAGNKMMVVNSGKAFLKSKAVFGGVSAVAIGSAVSLPIMEEKPAVEKPNNVVIQSPVPEKKPVPAIVIDSFPEIKETTPVVKTKKRKSPAVVAVEEKVEEVVESEPPKRDFKIQIVADSSDFSSEF